LPYVAGTVEKGLLDNDPKALGTVIRWIAEVLTWPRFWLLRPDAQDLHQEILTRIVASLRQERFDAARDFRTYVQAVARYTAQRERALRRGQTQRVYIEVVRAPLTNAERQVLTRQLMRRILETMGEPCRDLLISYFVEEHGYGEIAASLEIPVGTVKSRLSRCLESARRAMRRALTATPRRFAGTRDSR
jgi:RNA polymerase sigma-70 factor (ECF subfamily)